MRNYARFIWTAATQGGSPVTYLAANDSELAFFLSTIDPGSINNGPTEVWLGLDTFLFQMWVNRALGNGIDSPANFADPQVMLISPRGRGKVKLTAFGVNKTITFRH